MGFSGWSVLQCMCLSQVEFFGRETCESAQETRIWSDQTAASQLLRRTARSQHEVPRTVRSAGPAGWAIYFTKYLYMNTDCYYLLHGLTVPFLECCLSWLHTTTTTVLRPFFRDHPDEPVPEEKFWTLWCKGRLTEADTLTIRLGATPSGLTSAHLHHPPYFDGPDALPAAQPTVSKHGRH